ncbi:hypothetical protein ACOSQ4_004838 [Xanthoceras sorbifolium]
MLPQANVLQDSIYSTKKLLKVFDLGYEKIHALHEDLKEMEGIYANQSTSILDDIVSQVLGKEDHGQVRGLGSGITPTRVNASVASKQTTTRLRSEMNILKQQLQDLQSFVFNIQ